LVRESVAVGVEAGGVVVMFRDKDEGEVAPSGKDVLI
jgi:hypothetical protein